MTEGEARAELALIVEKLEGIRSRLQRVAAGLPPPPEEGPGAHEATLADLIRCVLIDRITPAIDDLGSAAASAGGEG